MTPEEVLPLREPVVSTPTPPSNQPETPRGRESRHRAVTGGEGHFLGRFIHGNIMTSETWNALLQAYGLCERHAWAHPSVETAFRKRHFLGPVIHDRAWVVETSQGIGLRSSERPLQGKSPYFLCALNISHAGAVAAPPRQLALGRDSRGLRSFAIDLAALLPAKVCTVWAGAASDPSRRRSHLFAELKSRRLVDLRWQQCTLEELPVRLAGCDESFVARANASADQDLEASGIRRLLFSATRLDRRRTHGFA
jgi:hypothetical protein